jgi:hypothetical protein
MYREHQPVQQTTHTHLRLGAGLQWLPQRHTRHDAQKTLYSKPSAKLPAAATTTNLPGYNTTQAAGSTGA